MKRDPGKHRSVALSYEPGAGQAPRIAAKGEGALADVILRLAREHGIPVENDPILAEALFRFREDDPIPPELYLAVAEVYAFLIRSGQRVRKANLSAARSADEQ